MSDLSLEDLQKIKLAKEIDMLDLNRIKLADELDELVATQDRAHVYMFGEDVNTESVTEAMVTLAEWYRHDPETAIEIVFTSPGGYCLQGLGFYDFIRDLVRQGASIETRAVGYACSMAGVLLQAGSTRSISRNSWLMIHEVSSTTWGKVSELVDDLTFMKRLQTQCFKVLASRSVLTRSEIMERCERKDWWLSSSEALTLGFVDTIR